MQVPDYVEALVASGCLNRISTDTRTLKKGDVFLALQGPNFDGHDYIVQAVEKGASVIIAAKPCQGVSIPVYQVDSTLHAYAQIAKQWRQQWGKTIVGITGSVGKTSTKEMLNVLLSSQLSVIATEGNFNNEVGVPKTLLGLTSNTDVGVIEMGAGKPGDISYLAQCAQPDMAIVTACAPVHIEFYPDLNAIAREKGSLFQSLSDSGTAIINADDPYNELWEGMTSAKIQRFGFSEKAHVRAIDIELMDKGSRFTVVTKDEKVPMTLQVPGKHMISNALAAITCALSLNIPLPLLKAPLSTYQCISGRLQFKKGLNGMIVIDDAYNSNPVAAKASLDVLAQQTQEKWFVMGQMGELGVHSESGHREVGDYAKKCGVKKLLAVGPLTRPAYEAFGEQALFFETNQEVIDYIKQRANERICCLIKGSLMAARMQNIVEALTDDQPTL
jgi:UDP-N-acetylmuramoyl-tripeptide--D-alanyl-D-alanine ligase